METRVKNAKRNASLAVWREENRDALRSYQREYMRKRRAQDPEKSRKQGRKDAAKRRALKPDETREYNRAFYHSLSPEQKLERARKSRQVSHESIRRAAQMWAKRNPGKKNAETAKRRAMEKLAMPHWVDRKAMRAVYVECKRQCAETGQRLEVDHIVPLQGKNVCGLHVPWNLQIIPSTDNRKKANRLLI